MTIATDLRAMREYIAKHGFTSEFGSDNECRCFMGASASVLGPRIGDADTYLIDFVGDTSAYALRRDGWTRDDALAVLDIAADCAEAEGK